MSINLPHWLAECVNVLGFNWPEIDEDQLYEAATVLRNYAKSATDSANATGQRIDAMSSDYQGKSYEALVDIWAHQSRPHMDTMIQGFDLLATGLDMAGEAVVVMKGKVIAQLVLAAEEVGGDQVAAFFTAGLAEGALPFLIAAQNRILNGILNQFIAEVVGQLLTKTLGPVTAMVEQAANKLMYGELAAAVAADAGDKLLLNEPAVRAHASAILGSASDNAAAGEALGARLASFTFSTAG